MPRGPFRKKKKKQNLPKPPSFSEEEEEVSLLQQELNLAGKPSGSKYRGPPKSNEFAGPPRTTETRKTPPPRLGGNPNLPPPPAFSTGQHQPPSSISGQPVKKTTSLFGNEAITDDILGELKQKKFGSDLEKTPSQKVRHKAVDELGRRHFQETKMVIRVLPSSSPFTILTLHLCNLHRIVSPVTPKLSAICFVFSPALYLAHISLLSSVLLIPPHFTKGLYPHLTHG